MLEIKEWTARQIVFIKLNLKVFTSNMITEAFIQLKLSKLLEIKKVLLDFVAKLGDRPPQIKASEAVKNNDVTETDIVLK